MLADNVRSFPPGPQWQPVPSSGTFATLVGPIFVTTEGLEPGEPIRFGFRVGDHHCNLREGCHGGMLATFLDVAMARTGLHVIPGVRGLPTISLTMDFLNPAHIGDWIESRITVLRRTPRMLFTSCVVMGPHGPVVRGSGIFRTLMKKDAPVVSD